MKAFTKISLSIALISLGLGMGLLILVVGRGSSLQYTPTFTMEDTVSDIRGLDIYMDAGEIIISQGDVFSIEANNLYNKDDLKSYVSDGVWVIRHDNSESLSLLGYKIPISINVWRYKAPRINITLPEGFNAEDIRISLNAGRLKANNLHTDRGHFTVDAGSLEINGLTVEEESSYFVGAGQINLKQVDIKNITVECDFGSVNMEGLITGDNEIQCNVGKITLDIDDDMELYSFNIDSELGNVIINSRSYRNYRITNDSNKYKGSFQLNVDVGNITMNFSEY
ncbi:MAG: hypothetical protein EWM47_06055 [Anaerolineaceae bacterium]|nr:MAG: hypothetical protein EWM47_06055 [Anaerolineaceae bacterium]